LWVGAKEEHQIISNIEPKLKLEEIKQTHSNKQDVDPHHRVKEEVVITPNMDKE
jgi:hypothetical protein